MTQQAIADKLHMKRETINRKIKKLGIVWHSKPKEESDHKGDPGATSSKIEIITEESYEQYLLKCINNEGDIRICTEIRNYLDKTQQLTKGKKDEVVFDLAELMKDEKNSP